MKKFFGLVILAMVLTFASVTSCNTPSDKAGMVDSTSISASVDTLLLDVDTTAVGTSFVK
jgi:hypothetical protein